MTLQRATLPESSLSVTPLPREKEDRECNTSEGLSLLIRADFWEGDATKHFSVKKGIFGEKGGGNSVNQGLGKDFYGKAFQ